MLQPLLPLTEGSVVFNECRLLYEPLIPVVIKVPLWLPQREVATGKAY